MTENERVMDEILSRGTYVTYADIAFATMPIHKAFVDEKAYLSLDGNKIAKKAY